MWLLVIATLLLAPVSNARRLAVYPPTESPCFVEHGFDYVGHDITNVRGAVDSCCSACINTNGCTAWSWSAFNGGTCWLKSTRGDVVANPNVKSAVVSFNPRMCQAATDIDFVGNDLARVDGASVDACCDQCHRHPGCRAYSWNNYLGGSCWLKSKGGAATATYAPGVSSAEAYPVATPLPTCRTMDNADFVGRDIAQRSSTNAGGCCELCHTVPNCRAYTWTNHNGGTCWLKDKAEGVRKLNGAVSGETDGGVCATEQDVDLIGNDIGNARSDDPRGCCTICRDHAGCHAYTWSGHNGGTCWLKSQVGDHKPASGLVSGLIAMPCGRRLEANSSIAVGCVQP